jgi:hypothetical protein
MNGINLIPSHRLTARRRAARIRMWMYIAPACITFLSGSYGYLWGTWETSSAPVQERLDALGPRIDEAERENARLKALLAEAKAGLAAARSIGEQPDWGRVLAYLAQKLGDKTVLTEVLLEPATPAPAAMSGPAAGSAKSSATDAPARAPGYHLTLSGLGLTQQAVTQLALDLTTPPIFDSVKLVESKRTAFSGAEAVAFKIECSIEEPEGRSP